VVQLLDDQSYRKQMAEKARHAAEDYYAWDAQMLHLDQVIEAVTRPAGPVGA
jgi:hypothetical protein